MGPSEENPPISCLGSTLLAVRILVSCQSWRRGLGNLHFFPLVSHSDPFCVYWSQVQFLQVNFSKEKTLTTCRAEGWPPGCAGYKEWGTKGLTALSIGNQFPAPVFSPTPHPFLACSSSLNCFSSSKYVLPYLKEHKLRHKR